jgi:hypothetical protein
MLAKASKSTDSTLGSWASFALAAAASPAVAKSTRYRRSLAE